MKTFAWIPFGLVAGFLAGFGVQIDAELLPLLAITLLVAGCFLIANRGLAEH